MDIKKSILRSLPLRQWICFMCFSVSTLAASDWPQFGCDSRHLSSNTDIINLSAVTRVFAPVGLNARITASPVIKGDTVYVGTLAGRLFAVNGLTGAILWTFPASSSIGKIRGSAVAIDDQIIVATEACSLYALNQAGGLLWSRGLHGAVISDLNYNPMMKAVYVTDRTGYVYSYSLNGTRNWEFIDTSLVYSTDEVAMNYGVASDSCFIAVPYGDLMFRYLKDNGDSVSLVWRQTFSSTTYRWNFSNTPVIYGDKIFYSVLSIENYLPVQGLLRATGVSDGSWGLRKSLGCPAVDPAADRLYVMSAYRGLEVRDLQNKAGLFGQQIYRDRSSPTGVVLSRDFVIYYGMDGYLEFRNKSNFAIAKSIDVSSQLPLKSGMSRPALSNGRIFFGSDAGFLYGYGDGSGTAMERSSVSGPRECSLQAAPNPFNPESRVNISLPAASETRLDIYDSGGRKVRTLFRGRLSAGEHQFLWDGRNESGKKTPGGSYFYRLMDEKLTRTLKIVHLR